MVYVDVDKSDRDHIWFLDLGCSNHMCSIKEIFSDLDSNFRESVKLGNNSSLTMLWEGKIRIEVKMIVQIITGVFCVSELKYNLLSISQL